MQPFHKGEKKEKYTTYSRERDRARQTHSLNLTELELEMFFFSEFCLKFFFLPKEIGKQQATFSVQD
jgi:hypothetical protein